MTSFIQFVVLLPSSPYIRQSTSTSTIFSLYSYSLHLDSQRPPSFTRTCTRKVNNQQRPPSMLTARLPSLVSPFLLTSSQLHAHSHKASPYLLGQSDSQSIHTANHKGPSYNKAYPFSGSIFNFNHATPTPTCSARVCQMLRQHTHLRGALSSHRRGVNSFKTGAARKGLPSTMLLRAVA